MPEIKVKHVVSFSSEDKVYKAENLLKPETYRKWKCASPGENKASVVLQFEKATAIHSIDIGNEHSAFVEVLVGRSSDSNNDYQVLLVTSSFMSPLESRNSTNANRVRMFGQEKLAQNTKNEKWDCVQIVCTQPFNKNVQYGLSFIKFHSVPDPTEQTTDTKKESELKLGGFKLKDEDDTSLSVGNLFLRKKEEKENSPSVTSPAAIRQASSYAAAVLENSPPLLTSSKPSAAAKRKYDDEDQKVPLPPVKKKDTVTHVNREKVGYKNIKEEDDSPPKTVVPASKKREAEKTDKASAKTAVVQKAQQKGRKRKIFNRLMEKVVFVISGIQNPERSQIRDRAVEMGAKYKADWDSTCTHLICAFVNTPKYNVVRSKNGRIVTKNWIYDCHKKKDLLPWRNYMLGKYSKSSTSEDESDEDVEEEPPKAVNTQKPPNTVAPPNGSMKKKIVGEPTTKNPVNGSPSKKQFNGPAKLHNTSLPSTSKTKKSTEVDVSANNIDEEDDDDTEAELDYEAATDLDSSSDGDTEDELRKFEEQKKEKQVSQPQSVSKSNGNVDSDSSTEEELSEFDSKPDTSNLELPVLPDFLKNKNFFLYGDFSPKDRRFLERYITAYGGTLFDSLNEDVKYVISESKWNDYFEEALAENDELIFVRPEWIYKCHLKRKCIPFHQYITIPGH